VSIELSTAQGRAGLAALLDRPAEALVAFDYDMVGGLAALSARVGLVAIITGRPARQAVELAHFDAAPGLERLVVLGHYGLERWDAASSSVRTVDPPEGLEQVRRRLPRLLATLDLAGAEVEEKGLSVAVHVRRLADPARALATMEAPLRELADDTGLVAEPGRFVIELRPAGMDKGQALRSLVEEAGVDTVVFTGDDLGDLPAFEEVDRLRSQGLSGVLICSGSEEVTALVDHADLVVDGPEGVATFIADLVVALTPR
jgi:trehalose 6-phosphate phosphatase